MSFAPAWLALRERADGRARDPGLLERAAIYLNGMATPVAVDLGSGTGATLRAFRGRAEAVSWCFVDNDPDLLLRAVEGAGGAARGHLLDLAEIAQLPLEGARLVTASALLDLMSADWVGAFADRLAAAGLGFYAALSYDGRMAWEPSLSADDAVTEAFNAHQRARGLGPDAAPHLAALLRARGYSVETARSDWRLGSDPLAATHARGVAEAAEEAGSAQAADWLQARLAAIASASSSTLVGHVDLLALPRGSSAQSNTTSVSRP